MYRVKGSDGAGSGLSGQRLLFGNALSANRTPWRLHITGPVCCCFAYNVQGTAGLAWASIPFNLSADPTAGQKTVQEGEGGCHWKAPRDLPRAPGHRRSGAGPSHCPSFALSCHFPSSASPPCLHPSTEIRRVKCSRGVQARTIASL